MLPEVGIEYVHGLRHVKYYETPFELMSKQYALAKIDEAKDSAMIQVLDKAVPVERRTTPKHSLITLSVLMGGAMLEVLLAFMLKAYQNSCRNPYNSGHWQALSAHGKNGIPDRILRKGRRAFKS